MPSRNGLRCLSGYQFKESSLLKRALTHRSFGPDNNERLEFLGDSVLGMVVSSLLYRRFPHAEEGQLPRMRARLVRRESLERIARRYHLGESLGGVESLIEYPATMSHASMSAEARAEA